MTLFGLAAVNDLQPGKQTESTLKKCNDFLFSVFGFPVGMVKKYELKCNLFIYFIFFTRNLTVYYLFFLSFLVRCSAFLDNLCLRQRTGLSGVHWLLLPSMDKPRHGLHLQNNYSSSFVWQMFAGLWTSLTGWMCLLSTLLSFQFRWERSWFSLMPTLRGNTL